MWFSARVPSAAAAIFLHFNKLSHFVAGNCSAVSSFHFPINFSLSFLSGVDGIHLVLVASLDNVSAMNLLN